MATLNRGRTIRMLAGILAAALMAAAGGQLWRLHQTKSEIRHLLARSTRSTSDEVDRILRFARDPAEAQLEVARQLLTQAMAGAPGLEATIETLAEAARRRRPQSFEAETVLGLARFLRLERSLDERLYKERTLWEAPLLRARTLAPTEAEPVEALVRTRLRIWFALSDAERLETRGLVKTSFLDPSFYYSVHGHWLELNLADPDFALAALPDRPGAWLQAQSAYHAMKAWRALMLARQGWYSASERALLRVAKGPSERSERSEPASAEDRLDLLAHSPANQRLASWASDLIEGLSIEELQRAPAPGLSSWWVWSLERAQAGEGGLSPAAMRHLAGALRDRPAPERALAALAAGDLRDAEFLEIQPDAPGPLWDDYYIAKVAWLESRGQATKATATLSLLTRRDTLRARLAAGEPPAANQIAPGNTTSAASLRFDAWLVANASGVSLALGSGKDSASSLVEVSADGAQPELWLLTRSQEILLRRPLAAGYHMLTVRTVFGEPPLVERIAFF